MQFSVLRAGIIMTFYVCLMYANIYLRVHLSEVEVKDERYDEL